MKKILTIALVAVGMLGICFFISEGSSELKGTYISSNKDNNYIVQITVDKESNTFVEYIDQREVDRGTIDKNTKNFLSEPIQKEINNIVNTCYENTLKILRENINDLHIVSKFLFENETMTCDQLEDLIRKEAAN